MPTIAITLDMGCCRCRSKIQKIICCIQERREFVIEKVVYEKEKVIISGPFDAVKFVCKLRCKAGCFLTNIEIMPEEKSDDSEKKNQQQKQKKKKKNQQQPPPAAADDKHPQDQPGSSCPRKPCPGQCHSSKPPACQCPPWWGACHCHRCPCVVSCWEEYRPNPCPVM